MVEMMDKMIETATKLTGVIHYLDEANPRDGARVLTLNGKTVISRLGGDRLLHYKDTTAAWREQYRVDDPIDFPVITSDDYDFSNADGEVPILKYPPVPPPKVGRPKKKGRIKSAVELSKQRQRSVPVCRACGDAGHISTNRQCRMHPKNPARRTNGSAGAGSAGAGSRRDGNDAQSEHAGAAPRLSARSQARATGKRDRGSAGATASDSAGQKKMRRKK